MKLRRLFDWRDLAYLDDGHIHHMKATKLLRNLPDESVGCVILDPPARMGVGRLVDDTEAVPVDDHIDALRPIAAQCKRVLKPGGITVMLGSARVMSAWEVVAGWEHLNIQGEIGVFWVTHVDRRRVACERPSLQSIVKWHSRPGNRQPVRDEIKVASNVIVVEDVPHAHRYSEVQRPVSLFTYLISHLTVEGDWVVDPMCGTGSALVASHMAERPCVGGDVNEELVKIARSRMEHAKFSEELESRERVWWWMGQLDKRGNAELQLVEG